MSRLRKPINKSKFKRILREYILPMLPTTGDLVSEDETTIFFEEHALIRFVNGRIYFYSSNFPNTNMICYSVEMTIGCENKAAAEKF